LQLPYDTERLWEMVITQASRLNPASP